MRPFLKWAGGKRQILPYIKKYINKDSIKGHRYFEPFSGGASVFFDLEHSNCVINDLNVEIINCYFVIKNNPEELICKLKEYKDKHSKDFYYYVRNMDRSNDFVLKDNVEKAARTIYLNRTCFNGLYRVNSQGFFNTPIGSYVNPTICDEENIRGISRFLNKNNVKITSLDFSNAVKYARNGDWIYFDPPYDYQETHGFVNYVKEGFNHDDLIRLKKVSDRLIKKGCNVLISNNDTLFVRELFSGEYYDIVYSTEIVKANRNINRNASNRKKVDEVLIYGRKK